ncbi:FecR domain-containing protein [soil metagenome]
MNNEMPWVKLAQYFAGELNVEENQRMENWIKSNPERENRAKQLYRIWTESAISHHPINVDDAWDRLSDNIDAFKKEKRELKLVTTENRKSRKLYPNRKKARNLRPFNTIRRVILIAASILILVSAGLFSFYISTEIDVDTTAEVHHHVLTTQHGERASYVLNDGSRVILHAGSRLEIPDNYNIEDRELYLEGEAYFETVHDTEKPFIVHSRHSYTRVVGTRFLMQAWDERGHEAEVIVSEGKVLFGDSRTLETDKINEVLVVQNQRGTFNGDKGVTISEVADMEWYLGWTEGNLIFEDRPLSKVLPRLERWYDVKIIIENEEIAAKRITAEIDYSLSMNTVLNGMGMSLDLEVKKEGRTITFSKND